ncbi:hypothetical protein [Acinetobacter pittii]|uniref:hypothetical protein n=1 Tax=Acinetobacter pittii TaxID=48296 RepID=UPI00396F6278
MSITYSLKVNKIDFDQIDKFTIGGARMERIGNTVHSSEIERIEKILSKVFEENNYEFKEPPFTLDKIEYKVNKSEKCIDIGSNYLIPKK